MPLDSAALIAAFRKPFPADLSDLRREADGFPPRPAPAAPGPLARLAYAAVDAFGAFLNAPPA
jgi:hypothetical protein